MAIGLSLAILGACLLVGQVSVTLKVTRAAPAQESNAAAAIYALHPVVVRLGSVVGAAGAVGMAAIALAALRRGRRLDAALLVPCAAGVLAAAWPFGRGWAENLAVDQMPRSGTVGAIDALVGGVLPGRFEANAAYHATADRALLGFALGCVLWVIVSARRHLRRAGDGGDLRSANERIERCLAGVRPIHLLAYVPACLLTAGIVSMFGSGAETLLHTMPVAQRYQITGAAAGYWGASLAIAMAFGLLHSVAMLNVFFAQFLVFRACRRLGLLPRGSASLLLGASAGLYVFLFGYNGLMSVFPDEVAELHFGRLVAVIFGTFSLLYAVLVSWNLVELCRQDGRPRDLSDLVRLFLLAAVLVPLGPVAGLLRRRIVADRWAILVAFGVMAALMAFLVQASFPTLVDHTSRAVVLWATGVTVVGVFLAYILFPPRRRGWSRRLAVLAAMLVVGGGLFWTGGSSAQVRLLFYEYAAISRAQWGTLEGFWSSPGISWEGKVTPAAPPPGPKPVPLPEPIRRWRRTKPLILLVIWDAARPDYMSLYGHKRKAPPYLPTTPHLDALRDELTWFRPAFSQATATTCSMRHLFTGRYASRFMLQKKGIGPFFTNELIRAGYELHLNIIGTDYNGVSEEAFRRDMPADVAAVAKVTCYGEQNDRQKVRILLDFLDRRGSAAGLFAYIHMTATHFPWRRRDERTPDFGPSHRDLYEHTMAYCDRATADLVNGLKARGLWEDTVLILTADHGTGLGEHGRIGGFHPYFEQITVPLVLRIPELARGKIDAMVGVFDIAPTLVEPFFPDRIAGYDAQSLWPIILDPSSRPRPRVLFGLSSFEDCYFLVTAAGLHYTWHRANQYELLYNCQTDPAELRSLLGDQDALSNCRGLMSLWLKQGKGRYTNPYHYKACSPDR